MAQSIAMTELASPDAPGGATLARGLEALRRHRWTDAFELLTKADQEGTLGGGDLEALAEASWFTGQADLAIEVKERAFRARRSDGDPVGAAALALDLARDYSFKRQFSIAAGWLHRAERLLEDRDESYVHGYLALARCDAAREQGSISRAVELAEEAVAIGERTGAIVGFPRDSYIETPEGYDDSPEGHFVKFTHANYWFGPEGMVQIAEETTGLDIDGYLITGFLGFEGLVDAFEGIPVDVPFAMSDPNSKAYLDAGLQILLGEDALAFSRNRHITDIDFRRSLDQGLVIRGALGKVQEEFGRSDLPALLAMLLEFTLTDLDAEALLTVAAGAFEVDPDTIPNIVLSGFPTTRNTQYVVLLDDEVADIFADLEDGMLTEELPPGTLTDDEG